MSEYKDKAKNVYKQGRGDRELNQSLRNFDMMNDYAIAHLSDQVRALTARMQEIERMQ